MTALTRSRSTTDQTLEQQNEDEMNALHGKIKALRSVRWWWSVWGGAGVGALLVWMGAVGAHRRVVPDGHMSGQAQRSGTHSSSSVVLAAAA